MLLNTFLFGLDLAFAYAPNPVSVMVFDLTVHLGFVFTSTATSNLAPRLDGPPRFRLHLRLHIIIAASSLAPSSIAAGVSHHAASPKREQIRLSTLKTLSYSPRSLRSLSKGRHPFILPNVRR
jgi:hypothetical protein